MPLSVIQICYFSLLLSLRFKKRPIKKEEKLHHLSNCSSTAMILQENIFDKELKC